jgi:hypothetical protein
MSGCSNSAGLSVGDGPIEQDLQSEITRLVCQIVQKKADESTEQNILFERLLCAVSKESIDFWMLPMDFRHQVYPHVLDGLMLRKRYEDAQAYLNHAIACHKGHYLGETFNTQHYMLLIESRIKMRDFSALNCSDPENAKKVFVRSLELISCLDRALSFSRGSLVPDLLKRVLGLCYYNMALSIASLGSSAFSSISKASALVFLNKSCGILDRPIDRLFRAEIHCGIAFLSGRSPRPHSLGLSEEEARSLECQRVFDQWKGLAGKYGLSPE